VENIETKMAPVEQTPALQLASVNDSFFTVSAGRPDWNSVFHTMQQAQAQTRSGADVGVFACGSSQMTDELHSMCTSASRIGAAQNNTRHPKFFFHKEQF
jgi:hypothetical protein